MKKLLWTILLLALVSGCAIFDEDYSHDYHSQPAVYGGGYSHSHSH